MVRWPAGLAVAFDRLLNNLGEVGPRRVWVTAGHGNETDRRRAEMGRILWNCMAGQHLEPSMGQNQKAKVFAGVARVSREGGLIQQKG
jgi:hypothetical protein